MLAIGSLRDILGLLRRRAWLIAVVLLIGLPLVLWAAISRPTVFEATAVIQIEAPQVDLGSGQTQVSAETQLELIEQQLMARDQMIAMVEEFSLYPELSMVERVAQLRQSVSIIKLIDPVQGWRPEVAPSGLAITVRLGDPQAAADVANELLARILDAAQDRSSDRTRRTLAFFEGEEQRLGDELAALETEFARFQEDNFESLPSSLDAQREQLSRLVEQRIDLEQQIIAFQTGSDRLREDEMSRRSALLEQQRDLIVGNIARIETALAAAPEAERRFNAFERRRDRLQDELAAVGARRTDAAMTQLLESQDQSARFEVLETAIVPETKISASRRKIAAAGGVVVLLAALALALAIEAMNPAIRTAAQLEHQLGVRPVVVIPTLRGGRPGQRRRMRRAGIVGVGVILAAAALALLRRALPGGRLRPA